MIKRYKKYRKLKKGSMMKMFNEKQTTAKSIDECVKIDPVSKELWQWSEKTERWGKSLFYWLIITGLISSILMSIITDSSGYPEAFNFMSFVTNLVHSALLAFIEFVLYHTIALLIASLATITQNTRVTAKLTEYKLRKAENAFTEYIDEGIERAKITEVRLYK